MSQYRIEVVEVAMENGRPNRTTIEVVYGFDNFLGYFLDTYEEGEENPTRELTSRNAILGFMEEYEAFFNYEHISAIAMDLPF